MGITCSKEKDITRVRQRRHLRDLNSGWDCSIVGTCLTMSDLRLIGKKLGLKTSPSYNIDYQHYGFFAHAVEKKGKPNLKKSGINQDALVIYQDHIGQF